MLMYLKLPSGAGLILTNPNEVIIKYAMRFDFNTTNNRAKYVVLITNLRIAKDIDINHIKVF